MSDESILVVTRRRFTWLLALAGLGTACKKEETSEDSAMTDTTANLPVSKAPARVADVHMHMFNANFLPLDGVLAKWVSGTTAALVAAILKAKTDDCGDNLASLSSVPAADTALDQLDSMTDDQLIEQLYRTTPVSAFGEDDVVSALSSVASSSERREQILSSPPQARRALAKPEFVKAINDSADQRPQEIFPERGGYLQWITLMTWCEHKIWAAARAAYPRLNLSVAHMMDMENYYPPSKPTYPYPDAQVIRMLNLVQKSGGKLMTFVAFDPARSDWESIIGDALAAGCAGVKFYPPNGYSAFDKSTGKVPERTAALFRYCITNDVPIFTHCTPHGFEALTGNGKKYADPDLWRRALEYEENGQQPFRNLRLCLGHSGGEQGWFPEDGAPPSSSPPFSAQVISLCRRFPNVYCEVAYLDAILKKEGQRRFQNALRTAIVAQGDFAFAKKIMYGSDWHMIHKIRNHRQYLPAFIEALGHEEWDPVRDDFFFNNAVRWLNLAAYVARMDNENPPHVPAAARDYLRQLITAAA
jgi:predicted TIM-barrel fold metal-dependent hydrolase